MDLTRTDIPTRERVFQAIVEKLKEGGSPTIRTIAQAVGLLSHSTVHAHLKTLQQEGRIEPRVVGGSVHYLPLGVSVRCPYCSTVRTHQAASRTLTIGVR